MYWDIEITPEDEEEMIKSVANKIHQYGMDVAAILMIESIKPLTFIGTQMGRFMISPFLPAFGERISMGGEKFLRVFEKRENVEKLIRLLEEMAKEEDRKKKEAKRRAREEGHQKKGWRRYFPF